MTSILKADNIQDADGNNIINESSNTITIGASGDTINVPSGATFNINGTAGTGVGISGWSSSSGSLLPDSASAGIYLGVNSATAANLLDDYEEGTWTPTFTHGGSAVSNVTVNKAHYTKIGRLVWVTMNARYTGSNLTGGDLIGAGLPFTSSANNVLGVTGAYIHDPGSGNTNYDSGIAGSHDSNTNFFLVVTPGGRYQQRWLQNYYLSFACWYFV